MAQVSNKTIARIRSLVAELQAFLKDVDAGGSGATKTSQPQQLPAVAAKIKKSQCLVCGKIVVKPEAYTRGLCRSDYIEALENIANDTWIESERIAAGLLALPGRPGKKRKSEARATTGEPKVDYSQIAADRETRRQADATKVSER